LQFYDLQRLYQKEVNIPVIAVSEIRTEEQVRFLIENDYVDFAAIGRGMLADPEFANHMKITSL
jgi:2,4-dienoyl-CoA reductase-like NADH-dependent reductase (Old Yellow Enzyme family)